MNPTYIPYIRGLVGHEQIFLAFVSVVLRDDQGRILLQQRGDFDVWGLPGGSLEMGETLEACARRELLEESGLTAGVLSLVGVYSEPEYAYTYPNGDQTQQFTICLQGQVSGGRLLADGVESLDLRFFYPSEIPYATLFPWYAAMLCDAQRLAENGGSPAFSAPQVSPLTHPQIETVRARIGKAPFIAVGSIAVVVDSDSRILMGHRTDDGSWDFPGGYSNLGENAAYTCMREAFEETGLHVLPERLMGVFAPSQMWVYPNGDQIYSAASLFRCRVVGGTLQADQTETAQVAWFTPAQVAALPVHPIIAPMNHAVLQCLEQGAFVL